MEPVLTQEELEAIYEAMKVDAAVVHAVDELKLTASQEFIASVENKWMSAAKMMAPRVESVLCGVLSRRVRVDILGAEIIEETLHEQTKDQLAAEADFEPLPEDRNAVIQVIRFGSTPLLLGLDRALAKRYIERRTGYASEGETSADDQRELTILEQRLLRDLVSDIAEAAATATPKACQLSVDTTSPREIFENRPPKQLWMIMRFAIQKEQGLKIWLKGPAEVFLPMSEVPKETLVGRLASTKVMVAAELGKFHLKVFDLWQMKPGTLVPLEATVGDPLRVLVGGVPKLRGEPLVSRGNIAIRITGREKG